GRPCLRFGIETRKSSVRCTDKAVRAAFPRLVVAGDHAGGIDAARIGNRRFRRVERRKRSVSAANEAMIARRPAAAKSGNRTWCIDPERFGIGRPLAIEYREVSVYVTNEAMNDKIAVFVPAR